MTEHEADVLLVLGTRPEIIKFAPVIRALERREVNYSVCHTGQHYSEELDAVFFDQLELPDPEYNLSTGSDTHARQTGTMLQRLDPIYRAERPEYCLVQGDTNSALAGGLVAAKHDVELYHIEAGLRSFDREMPEEINRVLVDHVADHLFAPTDNARELLHEEGIPDERIHVTGNTIVDAVMEHASLAAEKSDVLAAFDVSPGEYVVLTAHRSENVDDPDVFGDILDGVGAFLEARGLDCLYPIHPRAKKILEQHDITVPDRVRLVEPLDFLDFLQLERHAALVFTDSGGVQEEACILGVPCVTVRTSTERPESVDIGANRLAGRDPSAITRTGHEMLEQRDDWPCPFGDGTAAEDIVDLTQADTLAAKAPRRQRGQQ